MKILDGKSISESMLDEISKRVRKEGIHPHVAVILIGDDAPSHLYVSLKEKAAKSVGIDVSLYKMMAQESQESVLECVQMLSNDEEIDSILVQLPLPENFQTDVIINAISPQKDVDGFHPENVEIFRKKMEDFWPVFPKAIIKLIESGNDDISGKSAIVLANSREFGEMMVAAFAKKGTVAKYVLAKDVENNLGDIANADIVVTALGKANFIKGAMIKEGAIVIDGGITEFEGKVTGDIDSESFSDKDVFLSPVPGGVGPVTIACLLENVLEAALKRKKA